MFAASSTPPHSVINVCKLWLYHSHDLCVHNILDYTAFLRDDGEFEDALARQLGKDRCMRIRCVIHLFRSKHFYAFESS